MNTDGDIIRLCQLGRAEGFSLLLDVYQERVYRRAYSFLRNREDALDATQDVFERVLKAIDRFHQGSPIWPWLRQITTNTCLNRLRKAQSIPQTFSFDEAGDQVEAVSTDADPQRQTMEAWDRAWLDRALDDLPPLQRMVVTLRHQEELSYDEISQAMNLPLGTVKTYLFRARRALREAMQREEMR